MLKINSINLNSWTRTNAGLKGKICLYGDPDVICVSETHLAQDEAIDLDGYRWYGFNRPHSNGTKSGGVGILVRNELYHEYRIQRLNADVDGIICLSLEHIATGYVTMIASNYLPPGNSDYGRNPEEFFTQLLSLVYDCHDAGCVYLCGDFNARIGDAQDVPNVVHGVSPQAAIDKTTNSHGKCFLEFLNDAMLCVLNGRLSAPCYTCHTASGSSTVDYAVVPYDVLENVISSEILNVEELVDKLNLHSEVCPGSSIPDHDLTQTVLRTTGHLLSEVNKSLGAKTSSVEKPRIMRKFHPQYMNNKRIKDVLLKRIEVIEQLHGNQAEVNDMYAKLCNEILAEMKLYGKVGKRRATPFKPYWSPYLMQIWKNMKASYSSTGNTQEVTMRL